MGVLALLPWRYIGAFLALAAIVAGIWFHGHHAGAAAVQAAWDEQVRVDKEAAEAVRESNLLRARAAATSYETQRAAIAARLNKPSQESAYAFHATICPKPGVLGQPLELGDVVLPDAVLRRLRDAGADFTGKEH